ncbi:MAG: Crp/Fnr family transcriptional regulator [Acidobacteria bacterium]|nr:MAG: Crp/Fnr family transcriptional regulator [Acidobacteriota bacterium]
MARDTNFLRNVPIFSDLKDHDLELMSDVWVPKYFKKGNLIVLEEDAGVVLFVIVYGQVKIVRTDRDGREVILAILGPRSLFGEMSILDGLKRSASAVASTPAKVLMIERKDFLKLLHLHPSVGISLMRSLTMRLRRADAKIKSLSLNNATGRAANALLQLAEEVGVFYSGRVEIGQLPLRQEMANMAGITRETFCRVLRKFVDKGYLELHGRRLIITDYDNFRDLHR